MPGQESWGICGVGVIDDAAERAKAQGLTRQNGLYTLSIFPPGREPSSSVMGSIVEYLFAPADRPGAVARLNDPAVRIVSMTITEGGYNFDEGTGQFRLDTPDVAHDLTNPSSPHSVFGLIVAALARRRDSGDAFHRPLLRQSSPQWRGRAGAVLAFAEARDPALARWIDSNVTFPSCMVDRITPAVTAADVQRLNDLTGVEDAVPVFGEDFIQWVVEDRFCAGRPDLEAAGVQLTNDVGAYEQIKLRMLNSSHIMMSYPGQLGGYRFVHEAMADSRMPALLRTFLDRDVIPMLFRPRQGCVLKGYRDNGDRALRQPRHQRSALAADLRQRFQDPGFPLRYDQGQPRSGTRSPAARLHARRLRRATWAASTTRAGRSAPLEPHLTVEDLAFAHDPDPLAPLRILSTLKPLGLDRSGPFAESFVRFRGMIAERGALDTLGALDP